MMYATALIILAMVADPKGSPYVCDPALTALFTPPHPQMGRFEVCTSAEPLTGETEALEALEAFGAAGPYDRTALARLYGGTRVRVAHTWTTSADRFVSVTRLSPYPNASLSRLLPGTMEIRWTLQRSTQRPRKSATGGRNGVRTIIRAQR
jgi:hypothetical protein